ncbi:hypothetical protein [Pelagerythrobacter sp.]|uniref:hypothetical protein n=1 Tax=Pelagerythrobacter sp. TaxID=2800702 RepID=UPI0035B1D093
MRIAILGAALALAACNEGAEPANDPAGDAATPAAPATIEPAGLEVLGESDISGAALKGELACGFRREGEGEGLLFLGRGNVDRTEGATGAVKYAGQVVSVAIDGTGGYDAMADGARFTGEGLSLSIAPQDGEPLAEDPQIAMESPLHPATLTFTPEGGPEQAIQGLYECGP